MSTPAAPVAPVVIDRIDHLVLTVDFYVRVLGMQPVTFGAGRRALRFGRHKLNLHLAGHELEPKARRPTPGSVDVCLVTTTPLDRLVAHLRARDVQIEEGPVPGPERPARSLRSTSVILTATSSRSPPTTMARPCRLSGSDQASINRPNGRRRARSPAHPQLLTIPLPRPDEAILGREEHVKLFIQVLD